MKPAARKTVVLLVLALSFGCAGELPPGSELLSEPDGLVIPKGLDGPETSSLLGEPLARIHVPIGHLQLLEGNLARAQADYDAAPGEEDSIIWLGRRLAYLGRYREAVKAYTRGLDLHPNSARLLRHRGHRYITLRQFDRAIDDLIQAANLTRGTEDKIEPDGIPNAINQPLSTLHFNIHYHLGLAHYLKGDFESALSTYKECMTVSTNPDLLVATTDWMYMTLRRLGRHEEAEALLEPIHADIPIVENVAYHRRLLMYKSGLGAEDLLDLRRVDNPDIALNIATQGYGVANWYLYNGDTERALEILLHILDGNSWAAFGYIAAEADIARMGGQ